MKYIFLKTSFSHFSCSIIWQVDTENYRCRLIVCEEIAEFYPWIATEETEGTSEEVMAVEIALHTHRYGEDVQEISRDAAMIYLL